MNNTPDLTIYEGDNLDILKSMPDESINLIYIDPPFNTGKIQVRFQLDGKQLKYQDTFADFFSFIRPRLDEAHRILTSNGSIFVHIDYHESHYCRLALDRVFGRHCFKNEIIWAYDYGARSKTKWATKHDTIFWYTKNPDDFIFNYNEIDRIPYMAPDLVGAEKASKGKTVTDVWWHTIVGTNSKEKTGYPTQKPIGILKRIVKVHSNKGDVCCDFFAGSGSFGEAAINCMRKCVLIDSNKDAITTMQKRFVGYRVDWR